MNWRENWWRLGVLALVVVGLVWWRQQGATPNNEADLAEQLELSEKVDNFLDESGITLPEDSDRANLKDVKDMGITGVATRREVEGKSEYTVIAALPDLTTGTYQAWLKSDDGRMKKLGTLKMAKGGYLLDATLSEDVSGYSMVQVSQEAGTASQPTEIILEGSF